MSRTTNVILVFSALLLLQNCQNNDSNTLVLRSQKEHSIIVRFSDNSNAEYDSIKIDLRENGELKQITKYNDKLIDGIKLSFFENGNLQEVLPYENGKKHGRAYSFYESGVKYTEMIYENDINVGYGIEYFDSTANQRFIALYNDSGEVYYVQEKNNKGEIISEKGQRD